jgi:hypothetical protein
MVLETSAGVDPDTDADTDLDTDADTAETVSQTPVPLLAAVVAFAAGRNPNSVHATARARLVFLSMKITSFRARGRDTGVVQPAAPDRPVGDTHAERVDAGRRTAPAERDARRCRAVQCTGILAVG